MLLKIPAIHDAFKQLGWSDEEIIPDHILRVIEDSNRPPEERRVDLLLKLRGRSLDKPIAAVYLNSDNSLENSKAAQSVALWSSAIYFVTSWQKKPALFRTSLKNFTELQPLAPANTWSAQDIARSFDKHLSRQIVLRDFVAHRPQLRLHLPEIDDFIASITAQSLTQNIERFIRPILDSYTSLGVEDPKSEAFRLVLLMILSRILADRGELSPSDQQQLNAALNAGTPNEQFLATIEPTIRFLSELDAASKLSVLPHLPSKPALDAFRKALSKYSFAHVDASLLGAIYEKLVDSPRSEGRFYSQPPVTRLVFDSIKAKTLKPTGIGIADLSCGSGSFLVEAADWMVKNGIKGSLRGVDISDTAAALAQINLHIKGVSGIANIKAANGLIPKDGPTYNDIQVVVGNPPFGTYGKDAPEDELNLLRQQNYSFFSRGREKSLMFLEQALAIVPENGWVGMVLPLSKLAQSGGKEVREFILTHCKIKRLIMLPEKAFRSNYSTAIIVAQKEQNQNRREKNVMELAYFEQDATLQDVESQRFALVNTVPQSVWIKSPEDAPPLLEGLPINEFIHGIKQGAVPLVKVAKIGKGVSYGSGKAGIYLPESTKMLKEASAIKQYQIDYSKVELYDGRPLNRAAKENPEIFHAPKAILHRLRHPSLAQRLVAGLDKVGLTTTDNLINILPDESIVRASYLVALLNSSLLNSWFALTHHGFTLAIEDLNKIPIRLIDINLETEIERLVDKVLDDRVNENTKKNIESEIDNLIYSIYGIQRKAREMLQNYSRGEVSLKEIAYDFPKDWRKFPTAGNGLFGYQGVAVETEKKAAAH